MTVRLWWSPTSLANAAARCSSLAAAFAGWCICVSMTLLPLSAGLGSMAEPYRDLAEYARQSLLAMPVAFAVLSGFWAAAFFVIPPFFLTSTRSRLMQRVILLGPLTVAFPGLIWSVFAALRVFADPNCGFSGPGGKPAWLTSLPILFLGSPLWLVVGVGLTALNCTYAAKLAFRVLDKCRCSTCGYNLTGNVSGVCPECGQGIA